ncbi:MAG: CoA transferase, partial [Rhodospirillaceae bacterium]|nr:CoA transferase [Rhodospirillaceae bacterium]
VINDPNEGTLHTTAIPVEFSETPGTLRNAAPPLGADTETLLSEVGLSRQEIDQIQTNSGTG